MRPITVEGLNGKEADGLRAGLPKPLMNVGQGQMSCWVTGCHVERSHWESIGDEKTDEKETSTYSPQRKPEERHEQRRSVPAWYAVHQEAALIWNHTHQHF